MNDHTEIAKIQQRMQQCTRWFNDNAADYGNARQIMEFSSERLKVAKAKAIKAALPMQLNVAATEATALSSTEYLTELAVLERQYAAAAQLRAQWDATQCSYEAARSLLSMNREMLRL